MRRITLFTLPLSGLCVRPFLKLILLLGTALPAAERSDAIVPGKNIALFNGRDLSGFYTWLVDARHKDPCRVFTVTNGMIRISGEGLGYLSTRHEFQNYHLIAEFKWGTKNWSFGDRIGKARDSGIFLHSVGPDGNSHDGKGAFKAAIECQIMQGSVGDFLLIRGAAADGSLIAPRISAEIASRRDTDGWPYWRKGGEGITIERWGRLNWFGKDPDWRDRIDFRGAKDLESPAREWTRIECLCTGDRIQVKVNGTIVNAVSHAFPNAGKILLQSEGSEIFFRRLEIHPLDSGAG
jgi:hypothetical protein